MGKKKKVRDMAVRSLFKKVFSIVLGFFIHWSSFILTMKSGKTINNS